MGQFEVINAGYEGSPLPRSKTKMWQILERNRMNMTYCVYCCECNTFLGFGKKTTRDCGPHKKRQPIGIFVQLSITSQLKQLLRSPGIDVSLQYPETRHKWRADAVEDMFDSEKYRELKQNFLSNEDNYSLTLWVDGVQTAKSSLTSCVPVLAKLNELSPHARKRNIILCRV